MQLLFEEYLHASPSMHERSSVASSNIEYDDGMEEVMDKFDTYLSQDANARSQSQLELYLNESPLDRRQFSNLDVLDYWKGNSARYPELALMARDILSIPITTVASESAFSHSGRIIGKFRSSILPENAEAILCAYNSDSDEEEEQLSTDIEKLVSELGGISIQK
ncbi:hypothetical protein BUALT_Bualt10G0038600 [Buddleja alternifolia]|uniref:HAT C-terminal dimerisation domain-containing protein n=1 Tax=Buddleja alternifolia TaxID=168488 RepID=A0AAV6X336_9LAMI|nr:hypothetical protein BUALT_Bualt10G0038600 [Buddleja alternifolia]